MVNISKSKYVIFSNKNSFKLLSVRLGNGVIECVDSVRFLGVTLDKNLTFSDHISSVSIRISGSIGALSRVNNIFPAYIMKSLYYSMIHPHFMYAIGAWYGAPEYIRNKLVVLQKRAIKTVSCSSYFSHTDRLFSDFGILKLSDLFLT